MQKQRDKTLFASTVVLITFHLVGFIGIHSPYQHLFLLLTPVNLILSFILLLLNTKQSNASLILFCLITFLITFLIELIGIKTGQIFGEYTYGNTLGIKLFEVPIIIGLNWLILVYSVGCIFNKLKFNIIFKSFFGSLMLLILDFFIEPVAIKYDFWAWKQVTIPFQNYIAWFVVSFLLLLFFNNLKFDKNNFLAKALYIVELTFFILLAKF